MKLMIILGSVRENRFGAAVAEWYEPLAEASQFEEVELVDLAQEELPLTMEPKSPSDPNYTHSYTKRWSAKVAAADAYVLLMPEYNHAYSAALKNALDYVYHEWGHKPVAMVAWGSIGGARTIESILPVLKALNLTILNTDVRINKWGSEVENGQVIGEAPAKAAKRQLNLLYSYAQALKPLRERLNS